MSRFWNPSVNMLHPYVPGEQPQMADLVKLNTNESPYGPSPKALQAIKETANSDLRLYPDPTSSVLREALARQFDLHAGNIFVGNGSDEVLAHAFRALLREDEDIIFADVTYGFYPVYCTLFGLSYRSIPLRQDFSLAVQDYTGPCGGIVIANPNAQTGRAITVDDIEILLKSHSDRVVIIDEAYVDFGADSAVSLIKHYDNLLVVRTFSKSSALAGLRVGYALGDAALIEGLVRVKDSFNSYPLSRLSQAGALASLQDQEWFVKNTKKVMATRERLIPELKALGFDVVPSKANFILINHPDHDAFSLTGLLRKHAILVRHLPDITRIHQWLRVTIGSDEQCNHLVKVLKQIL